MIANELGAESFRIGIGFGQWELYDVRKCDENSSSHQHFSQKKYFRSSGQLNSWATNYLGN